MRLSVHHRTTYEYDGEVRFSAQYLHLSPMSNPSQRVLRWRIDAPGQLTEWRDAFGNVCHTLVVDKPVSTIEIAAHGQIETTDMSGVLPAEDGGPPLEVFLRETPLTRAETRIMDFAAPHRASILAARSGCPWPVSWRLTRSSMTSPRFIIPEAYPRKRNQAA